MIVLVIGGTGFLSAAVVGQLREANHDVTIFTRGRNPAPQGIRTMTGDRGDTESFVQRFAGSDYDAVVDCICYTPDEAEADLKAFGPSGAHLVVVSTDFVYGADRRLPMEEDTPRLALNSYGRNKALCEDLLFASAREGRAGTTVLRPPHIMGPGGQLGSGSLQGRDPMLLDRLRKGVPVLLLDGGSLLLQPVVHEDVGRACAAVLGRESTFGQAYNVAGPDVVTTRRYYELIAGALGVPLEVRSLPAAVYAATLPEKAPFALHRTYSVAKLAADTGYRPATGIDYAIFSMIDWLEANQADQAYVPDALDEALLHHSGGFEAATARLLRGELR